MFVVFRKYVCGSIICLNIKHIKSVESKGNAVIIETTLKKDDGLLYIEGKLEDVLKSIGAEMHV